MTDTAPKIASTHAIRMKFRGPSNTLPARWIVTWVGWPGETRPVRRSIASTADRNCDAACAATMFVNWLNGIRGGPLRVATVHYGEIAPEELAVTITTRDERDTPI